MPYADLFGALGARIAGQRVILSSRHRDYSTSPREVRRFRRYYRVANPLHRRVIAISHRIADLCRSEERRDPATVHVVWYGCADQAAGLDRAEARARIRVDCGLSADAPLIGTVGRLIPLKGHRYALEAFAAMAARLPKLVWLFVGAGPERDSLEAQARSRGLASRVRFLGHRDDVPHLLAGLDLLVHPTLVEGFGLGVLEAMVQGLPVVATRTGALPETVIDGLTGVLVPPRDPEALGEAIVSLLADRARMDRLGQQGRARYEAHFRLERMVRETVDVYERSIAAG
jgi:glycosyltransferase involved in cell wall biosynthesis